MHNKNLKILKGKEFKVDPLSIDKSLFLVERRDKRQEKTRLFILMALDQVEQNPEKYSKVFYKVTPKKYWISKTIEELIKVPSKLGGNITDWVEEALSWAQRITNGETWRAVCNDADTEDWCRLIKWMDGTYRIVGSSRFGKVGLAASNVRNYAYVLSKELEYVVPSVTIRIKKDD